MAISISTIGIQLGVALGIVGVFLVLKELFPPQATSIVLLIVGALALAFTWYALYWLVHLAIVGLLTPWDLKEITPPLEGTWQRQLGVFFSQDAVQCLLALAVVAVSIRFFLIGMLHAADGDARSRLPLAFAGTNVVFQVLNLLFWPRMLGTVVLLGLLFWIQRRIAAPSFWKRRSALVAEGDG